MGLTVIRHESCCSQQQQQPAPAATPLVGREGAGLSRCAPLDPYRAYRASQHIEHMPLPTKAVDGNHDIFPVPGLRAADRDAQSDGQSIRAVEVPPRSTSSTNRTSTITILMSWISRPAHCPHRLTWWVTQLVDDGASRRFIRTWRIPGE
ncbi:hypothetical protein N431DRAFT_44789 [Stipitochalara longipes BDJ]|nr:hypothetical protein N431DRAFT_44789 [Stipitochalara longipes BDJ]